MAWDLIRRLKG